MDVRFEYTAQKKIKTILIFFCVMFFLSCAKEQNLTIKQLYNNSNSVIGIQFLNTTTTKDYKIVLKGSKTPVLGTFKMQEGNLIFNPVIPFTRNSSYEIFEKSKLIKKFNTGASLKANIPAVQNIYPTTDTVPENLLKMYFVFSEPMQEVGNILDYIMVTNKTENIQEEVFLELESELWNK